MSPNPNRGGDARTPLSYRWMAVLLAPLERLLGIDCRSFSRMSSRALDEELTAGERLRYRLHRVMCSLCRRHDDRLQRLHAVLGQAADRGMLDDQRTSLSPERRETLRRLLVEELGKAAPPPDARGD